MSKGEKSIKSQNAHIQGDYMSRTRSKNILGVFAILIMMHHLSQKASAFWVPASVRQHGLEPFVPIGYLLVSFFFFCSGYGLRKSMKADEDYFDGFLLRRTNRILMIFVITSIIWMAVRFIYGNVSLPVNPYGWYIYACIILYFGFFFIYRKETKISHILMGLWILIYSVICYLLIKGNWWFNATPIFLLGIIMADKEPVVNETDIAPPETPFMKKLIKIIIPAIIFVVTFIISENFGSFYKKLGITDYGIVNIIIVILQIVCCGCFNICIYVLASRRQDMILVPVTPEDDEEDEPYDPEREKRRKERNKEPITFKKAVSWLLSFYGSMTLEFYLIHGLFVQIFGHHFIDDRTPPVCYIRNIVLYVLVVFIISTVAAFLLKKAGDLIIMGYENLPMFERIFNDQKRLVLIILGIFAVITMVYSVHRHNISKEVAVKLEEYKNEKITYVNAGGTEVATYSEGEGEYTVVLLGSEWDPCPTMYLIPMLNNLKDTYKVVIIDYPGKGYSADTDADRTADFYADIIHGTLEGMGVKGNIILVPNQVSAIYSFRYIEKYPEGVKGFVGIDAIFPELATRFLDGNYNSVDEYRWYLKRISRLEKLNQKLLVATGYVSLQTPIFDYVFYGSGLKEYYGVMEEMYIRNYMMDAHLKEQKEIYDNCMSVEDFKLPENLHASFLLNNTIKDTKYYGVDWVEKYNELITNKDIQSVTIINGSDYVIYYNPGILSKKIDELVEGLD